MSLNLRIGPRRRRRRRIYSLLAIALLLSVLAAWRRGWHPEQVLADLRQDALTYVPAVLPNVQAQSDLVDVARAVKVNTTVIHTPQSEAYTAPLYIFTGKDVIPWPNVGGRTSVEIYVVESGDTLWSIAAHHELDLDTLRWSNPDLERNPDVLAVGTELRILPVIGAFHLIESGDTVESISAKFGVPVSDIVNYPPNALFPPYDLKNVEGLIIPYGRKNITLPQPSLSSEFAVAWPLVGSVTGDFDADHPALDIGAPYGSTVYAVDDGTITYARWAQDGYGYTVVIDHGDGRQSWYNHLKGTLLSAGTPLTRGTPIGEVGSTGHSSGPHLHFELHLNGERVDPHRYLPGIPQ